MDIDGQLRLFLERRTLLSVTAFSAVAIGLLILIDPLIVLVSIKHAQPNDVALVMARTAGILLVSMGLLDFLVRNAPDCFSMVGILVANLVLQVGIIPIDILAYAAGTFATLGSFVPNTILHIFLALGYVYHLWRLRGMVSVSAV